MSKLEEVRKALFGNAAIVVIDIQTNKFDPDRSGYHQETVDFTVAPKKGIYDADKLQELMMKLVPGVSLTCKDDFRSSGESMQFGKLYFDENIGEEKMRREITITDKTLLSNPPAGFENGKKIIEQTSVLERRTWVRLYPNARIALKATQEGEHEYSIEFDKLRPGERFVRILHRLGCYS